MRRTRPPALVPADETPPGSSRRGRPRLSDDELRTRVAAYCERYGVRAPADGQPPPFPSGRRETPQHREWLAVYRALRRRDARSPSDAPRASGAAPAPCPVCGKPLPASAREVRLGGRTAAPVRLHEACADLLERLQALGARAASRAGRLLWGTRPPD